MKVEKVQEAVTTTKKTHNNNNKINSDRNTKNKNKNNINNNNTPEFVLRTENEERTHTGDKNSLIGVFILFFFSLFLLIWGS